MGKYSEQLNKKFKNKYMEKKQNQENQKYFNQAYRPDAEVKLTGEKFMYLRKLIQDIRGERVIRVIDNVGNQVGQGLPPRDFDIENLYAYLESLHREQVDLGNTVSIEVLKKEFMEAQKKEQSQEVNNSQVSEIPSTEAVGEVERKSAKIISIKK